MPWWGWIILLIVGIALPILLVYCVGVARWITHADGKQWRLGIDFAITIMAASTAFALDLIKRMETGGHVHGLYIAGIVAFIILGVALLLVTILSELLIEKRAEILRSSGHPEPEWRGSPISKWCVIGCNLLGTVILGGFLLVVLLAE